MEPQGKKRGRGRPTVRESLLHEWWGMGRFKRASYLLELYTFGQNPTESTKAQGKKDLLEIVGTARRLMSKPDGGELLLHSRFASLKTLDTLMGLVNMAHYIRRGQNPGYFTNIENDPDKPVSVDRDTWNVLRSTFHTPEMVESLDELIKLAQDARYFAKGLALPERPQTTYLLLKKLRSLVEQAVSPALDEAARFPKNLKADEITEAQRAGLLCLYKESTDPESFKQWSVAAELSFSESSISKELRKAHQFLEVVRYQFTDCVSGSHVNWHRTTTYCDWYREWIEAPDFLSEELSR